jgi:hypothetical protein
LYRRPASERRNLVSFSFWLRKRASNRTPRRQAQRQPAAPRFRPLLEALEDRCVPSTLKVTNNYDSGPGSLRYEIAQARSNDTIVFDFGNKKANNTPQNITLTSGELEINKNLTIQGPGAGLLTVTSTGLASPYHYNYGSSRIFEVDGASGTNVTLSGMTISNGDGFRFYTPYPYSGDYYDGTGGGILNFSTLTISGCTLSSNFAADSGGGIANFGKLTVSGCTLSNNNTDGNGGGIYNAGALTVSSCNLSGNTSCNGGGICNASTMTVSGCTLSGNYAYGSGGINFGAAIGYGGGGICNFGGTMTVSGSTLTNNSTLGNGGGILNGGAASALTVLDSIFSSNSPDNIYGPYTDGGGNTFN